MWPVYLILPATRRAFNRSFNGRSLRRDVPRREPRVERAHRRGEPHWRDVNLAGGAARQEGTVAVATERRDPSDAELRAVVGAVYGPDEPEEWQLDNARDALLAAAEARRAG